MTYVEFQKKDLNESVNLKAILGTHNQEDGL